MNENRFNPLGIGMGSRIADRYEIAKMVGAGAMSAVYKAYDKALNNQPCALKILSAALTENTVDLERFRSEVMITRALTHENIVRTFEFGQVDNGLYFIAMEYLEGITLEQLIHQSLEEPLPLLDILRILRSIAVPLAYAHSQSVVHRDVKPANVLIGENGQIKLTDFGLAKTGGFQLKLTQAGESVGSPAYMSPEQMKGTTVDHRSDLYALGVIAFEMVSRRLPYEADSPYELGAMICSNPFPRLKRVSPGVPDWLDSFVQKACAFEADRRFQSAEEMIAHIDEHMGEAEGKMMAPSIRRRGSTVFKAVFSGIDFSMLRIAPIVTFGCLMAFVALVVAGSSDKPVKDVEAKMTKSSAILKDLTQSVSELTQVAIQAHENRDKIKEFIRDQEAGPDRRASFEKAPPEAAAPSLGTLAPPAPAGLEGSSRNPQEHLVEKGDTAAGEENSAAQAAGAAASAPEERNAAAD